MAAGGGGWGHGGKRKRSSLSEVSAKNVELRREVDRLSAQLQRRETDEIQALKGEMSAERQKKDALIEVLQSTIGNTKSNRSAAQRAEATARTAEATARTAETDARNEHLVTLHDLTKVRLELEKEKHRAEVLEATVRSARAEASADMTKLSAKLTRAEKMIVYRNEKIDRMNKEALSVASSTEDAMSTMRATAIAQSGCAAQVRSSPHHQVTVSHRLGHRPCPSCPCMCTHVGSSFERTWAGPLGGDLGGGDYVCSPSSPTRTAHTPHPPCHPPPLPRSPFLILTVHC